MKESPTPAYHRVFNVYGVTVALDSADSQIVAHLSEDFEHFHVDVPIDSPDLSLYLHPTEPPYECVPDKAATVYTPRNVSFESSGLTYIDYSGRALGILDSAKGIINIFSKDTELLYEAGYLFLLSQLSERLDERGLHRIHALAVSINDRAALVLLPMGGGKSTLAMHLLTNSDVKFLSDDSPVVDRHGVLHAFPLRIGILPGSESLYRADQLRTIQRIEFGPKLLLRHEYFADRIVSRATPNLLFLGRRSLSDTCLIRPSTRIAALRALIPNCVIGLGLFQGMEFVFNRSSGEILRKFATALSRFRNCVSLARRSSVYTVVLGRDHENNAATLRAFIGQNSD